MNDCALNCESAFADSIAVAVAFVVIVVAVIVDNGIVACDKR